MSAAIAHRTMHTITGTNISPWMPHNPKISGNMPHASAPQANCRPISERPDDVSRVAIITAVFKSAIIETGKISAMERINKYDQ